MTPFGHQDHHVIPRMKLRQAHVPRELWDDPRNIMRISYDKHRRHHSRHEPLLRSDLPDGIEEFAEEVGLGWWLDRHYPIDRRATA